MAIKIDIEKQLQSFAKKASAALVDKIVVRSINKTLVSTRADVVKNIRKDVKIKASDLKKRVYARKYVRSRARDKTVARASIMIYARDIPLIKLSARPKRVASSHGMRIGVTAIVHGRRQLIPGAFIGRSKSGFTGVFKRSSMSRLPIKEQYSDELSQALNKQGVLERAERFAIKRFREVFNQEFKFEMTKALNKK